MILIASNNPRLVNRWSRGLQSKYQLYFVNQKSSLLRSIGDVKPLLLLLDMDLPRLRAVRELPEIQKFSSVTKIIVFSASPTTREGMSLLRAGARGYCDQDVKNDFLHKALKSVLRDEIWAGRKTLSELVKQVVSATNRRSQSLNAQKPLDGLTARKRQVASFIMNGATNKEIANQLGISEAAVKAHVTGIFRRLHLSRRHQLARFVNPLRQTVHPKERLVDIELPKVY